jgi:hypothetical protein
MDSIFVNQYGREYEELLAIKEANKALLNTIEQKETSLKNLAKSIEKGMKADLVSELKGDSWVARLVKGLKYKVIRPDYKECFEIAKGKVNGATMAVLEKIVEEHKAAKAVEEELKFSIEKEN